MTHHVSDSSEQREAEDAMLSALARKLDLTFDSAASSLPIGVVLKPDAIDRKNRVLIEAYAHIGKLKGAQPHKVKGDILKLILVERKLGGSWRKILCFADNEAAQIVLGKSWVAEAAREFRVEVQVVPLPKDLARRVLAAQDRQRMENPK